jgi:hypothetical protein
MLSSKHFLRVVIMCSMLFACTFTTTLNNATPTTAMQTVVTNTPLPTTTLTETLRPTVTNLPTFTPVNAGIATPIPLSEATSGSSNGGFGFGSASVQSSGSNPENSNSGGVSPIGVRETPSSAQSSSSSVGVGARGGGSVISVTRTPELPQGGSGGGSVIITTNVPSPLTPTVPPSVSQRYDAAVGANATLIVNYDITIARGNVVIWVVAPSGQVIWQEGFSETINSETEIIAPQTGEYEILAFVDNFSGNFQLGYGTR